ncbi:MAG: AtpZ/AtpI family protein [Flavobacteriales bacterium]
MPLPPKKRPDAAYSNYLTTSFKMAIAIGIGVYGGIKLDGLIDWKFPLCTILLSLLGVALGIYILVRDTGNK